MRPLTVGGVIRGVLDIFSPTIKMSAVNNTNMQLHNAFELLPSTVTAPPRVEVIGGDMRTFYMLLRMDSGAPSPSDPTKREYLYWIKRMAYENTWREVGCRPELSKMVS